MLKRILMLTAAAVALCGCASVQELAARDDASCRAQGAEPGSEAYVLCRNLATQQRFAERQAFSARMSAAAQALRDRPAPAAQAPAAPTGFTQVCTYDTIMGPKAITISAAAICPLTAPS